MSAYSQAPKKISLNYLKLASSHKVFAPLVGSREAHD
jgi:hypothetical protein